MIPTAAPGLVRQDRQAASSRKLRQTFKFLVVVVLMLGGLIAGLLGYAWFTDWQIDQIPLSAANYRAAAPDLIKLCQTDPGLLRHVSGGVDPYTVASVGNLDPKSVTIEADYANVMWGGGFHHAGWHLRRLPDETADASNHTWQLSFYGDGREDGRDLQTFTMPADAHFTEAELADYRTQQRSRTR